MFDFSVVKNYVWTEKIRIWKNHILSTDKDTTEYLDKILTGLSNIFKETKKELDFSTKSVRIYLVEELERWQKDKYDPVLEKVISRAKENNYLIDKYKVETDKKERDRIYRILQKRGLTKHGK